MRVTIIRKTLTTLIALAALAEWYVSTMTTTSLLPLSSSWRNKNNSMMPFADNNNSSSPTTTDDDSTLSFFPYAYAFVIGGCGQDVQPAYIYYVYNVLIAARILRDEGTRADVIAFVQMHADSSYERLPQQQVQLFKALNVTVYYIPKAAKDTFYSVSLQKFRILGLTQYRRILCLDADTIPLGNLDFYFELSERGILKENLIVPDVGSPANAGFFMVAPYSAALREANDIIRKKEDREEAKLKRVNISERVRQRRLPKKEKDKQNNKNKTLGECVLAYKNWDEQLGWGHVIQEPDQWEKPIAPDGHERRRSQCFRAASGTLWDYWGAPLDQGFLYHWAKYHSQSVSIVQGHVVQNWGSSSSGPNGTTVVLEKVLERPFEQYAHAAPRYRGLVENCELMMTMKNSSTNGDKAECAPPITDFMHFFGRFKPWKRQPPVKDLLNGADNTQPMIKSALHLWFHTLTVLHDELDLGLGDDPLQNWPPLDNALFLPYKPKRITKVREKRLVPRTDLMNAMQMA